MKRTLFALGKLKQDVRGKPLLNSAGNACGRKFSFFAIVSMCMSMTGLAVKALEYWLGVQNKIQWVGKFTIMKSSNNKDQTAYFLIVPAILSLSSQVCPLPNTDQLIIVPLIIFADCENEVNFTLIKNYMMCEY